MVVTISKRAPWNLGKQMLQIFPEPCEKCGLSCVKNALVFLLLLRYNGAAIEKSWFKPLAMRLCLSTVFQSLSRIVS
ncbi:MAG: hypothetical protein AAF443_08270 [Chlamydiota bacterium]